MNIPIANNRGKTITKGSGARSLGSWQPGVHAKWKKKDVDKHASTLLGEKIAASNRAYLRAGRAAKADR